MVRYSKKGIVAFCTIAYFASYFSRKTFPVVMASMLEEGALDKSVAGLIGTALFVFYGAGQLISGYLGDRLQPKYLMFSGLMLSAVCNLLMPLMPNGYVMIPVWAVNGFAQALLWPPIVRILSDNLSHEKYVTANMIVTCGAHVSTIVLYLYAPLCISVLSWETVFFTSTVLCILAGIIFITAMCIILPSSANKTHVPKQNLQKSDVNVGKIVSSNGLIPIFVCIVAMGFMRDGIESWLPTLYMEVFKQSSENSILVSVALPIFSIISLFLVKIMHKRKLFNNEATGSMVLFGMTALLCLPVCFLVSAKSAFLRILCLIFACIACACMHSCNFLLISCVPGRFAKTGRASTIGGICNACTYTGAATSMYGIALVSDALGWSGAVASWVGISLVGVLFAFMAVKKYTKFLKSN